MGFQSPGITGYRANRRHITQKLRSTKTREKYNEMIERERDGGRRDPVWSLSPFAFHLFFSIICNIRIATHRTVGGSVAQAGHVRQGVDVLTEEDCTEDL